MNLHLLILLFLSFALLGAAASKTLATSSLSLADGGRPVDMLAHHIRRSRSILSSEIDLKCVRHNYTNWTFLVSPCLGKKAANLTIPWGPGCGQTDPSKKDTQAIQGAIDGLVNLVHNSPFLLGLANKMVSEIPPFYATYCPGNFTEMIYWLRATLMAAPQFQTDNSDFIGVPVTNTLLCYLHTISGLRFFANPSVNNQMRTIINAWGNFLQSPESVGVLNNGTWGWMSPCAQAVLNMSEIIHDPSVPHWGFYSWNDFFTRTLVPGARPISSPGDDNVVTSFADIHLQDFRLNLKLTSRLWIKNEEYSLKQAFAGDLENAKSFVGGAAIQGYLTAKTYHRYHSPVAGHVVYAMRVPGLLFTLAEPLVQHSPNLTSTGASSLMAYNLSDSADQFNAYLDVGQFGLVETQLFLAHVATRCIFIIENPTLGKVGFITIGMTDVSSCTIDPAVGPGATVTKGQELGMFQFGGSTAVMFLTPKVVKLKEKCMGRKIKSPTDFFAVNFFRNPALIKIGEILLDLNCK